MIKRSNCWEKVGHFYTFETKESKIYLHFLEESIIEIPADAIDHEKLMDLRGRRISMLYLDGSYYIRKCADGNRY